MFFNKNKRDLLQDDEKNDKINYIIKNLGGFIMYPFESLDEVQKYHLDEKGKVDLSLHFRDKLGIKPGDEINIYFHDTDDTVLCIRKPIIHCHSCGTPEGKLGELLKGFYLCEKCFRHFMIETFGRC